mgnify:CR=1 FL=1
MACVSKNIIACVVLHNFCILIGDGWEEEDNQDNVPNNKNSNSLRDAWGDNSRDSQKQFVDFYAVSYSVNILLEHVSKH